MDAEATTVAETASCILEGVGGALIPIGTRLLDPPPKLLQGAFGRAAPRVLGPGPDEQRRRPLPEANQTNVQCLPELVRRTTCRRSPARSKLDDTAQRALEAVDEAGERVETHFALPDVLTFQMDLNGAPAPSLRTSES